ncbi:unnamed protein product, partial [Nesidiocoris tenuis]
MRSKVMTQHIQPIRRETKVKCVSFPKRSIFLVSCDVVQSNGVVEDIHTRVGR